MTPLDDLRRALAALDATPAGFLSMARAEAVDALIRAARAAVAAADRDPYPARAMPPPRPSLSEDDGA
jgi:hypothetical protein